MSEQGENGTHHRVARVEREQAEQGRQIAGITAAMGRLEATVGSLADSLHEITSNLKTVAARQNERTPTNWGWILAGVAALGSFVVLNTGPLEQRDDRHTARLDRLDAAERQDAIANARQDEALRWLEKDYDRRAAP